MRRPLVNGNTGIAKINVTPIIDVALTLVIILMMSGPMLAVSDVPVDIPPARTRGAEDESRVMITLGKNGDLAIDNQRTTRDALPGLLHTRLSGVTTDVLVVVRADRGTPYVQVSDLLQEARAAGAKRLAIATRQKGDATP
jgi:biopolymer transport protein ExbD